MARPERNDVDYFPFYCKEGKTMFYIEQTYGNDGFAVWVKLLRSLATTNHHFLNLSSKPDLMFLSSKCRVEETLLLKIISDLAEFGEIDKELWEERRVIWSEKFIDSIRRVYDKRSNTLINKRAVIDIINGNPGRNNEETDESGHVNPESKVKERKVKESKGEINQIAPEIIFKNSARDGIAVYTAHQLCHEVLPGQWLDELAMRFKIDPGGLKKQFSEWATDQELGGKLGRALGDIRNHFFNILKKQHDGTTKNQPSFKPGGFGKL